MARSVAATVRFWDCAAQGCPNAAAIDVGDCERCRSIYCATHIKSALHLCEHEPLDDAAWEAAQTAELVALNHKMKHAAIIQRAKELSGGLECHLDEEDPLGRRQMGGMHIHLELLFEDGTVWLARILRERYTSFDEELSNQILLSECATLRWLESVDVPTPRLYGYGLRGDPQNQVGLAYMIIDKMPGRPFDSGIASESQRSRVMHQWADILCVLGNHPLDKIGSLKFKADGAIETGPIASDRTGTLPCIGPFEDARNYYRSWANTYLELIADGQLYSPYAVDAYLMFKFLAEQAEAGPWLLKWQDLSSGPFFLKHADDKGDHILIDDDFQITGIIDWSFARAVPAYEAFGPSLVSSNTGDLFGGKPGLSKEDGALGRELQRSGAPYCFFESDEMRRFLFGPGMGLNPSKEEAISLFRGLAATLGAAIPGWEEWRQASLVRWGDDTQLESLCQTSPTRARHCLNTDAAPTSEVCRFATCSFSNCGRPSVRGRSCQMCEKHLCAVHILRQHHHCPSSASLDDDAWEKSINNEVEALLAQINIPELARVASSLRGGIPCKFQPGKHVGSGAIMGCANYHCWIIFDDGVRWLARIPRTTAFSDIPLDLVDYLVESEFATLKLLEGLAVPTPKAHGFGLFSDPGNLVGVGYILEDAMPGQPFYAHQATTKQKRHVYDQYAEYLIQISDYPTEQSCSLVYQGGETKEAPIASNRFLSLGKHGPFAGPLEYFTSIADLHLDIIADGQLYPEYPKEAFLFYRLLRDRAAPALADVAARSPSEFFLKHVDDKGDHLLVDDDYNITAVIDWQFARFVPAVEAFGPSLFTADMGKLYSGSAALSVDDDFLVDSLRRKGRGDLAEHAGGTELARRFQFGLASGLSKSEVLGMTGAVLSLLGDGVSDEGLVDWAGKEWTRVIGDARREKVEVLVAELERQGGDAM